MQGGQWARWQGRVKLIRRRLITASMYIGLAVILAPVICRTWAAHWKN